MEVKDYLSYLEQKERRIIFSIRNRIITHGHVSAWFRTAKGMILGFGLGNLLIQQLGHLNIIYYILAFIASAALSLLLVHHERRHYRRKGMKSSAKTAGWILLACLAISLTLFIYSDARGFTSVLATTLFFASLTYSRE